MEEGVGRFIVDTCLQKDDYGGWKGYDAGTNAQLEQQARSPQFAPLPPAHEQSRRCSTLTRVVLQYTAGLPHADLGGAHGWRVDFGSMSQANTMSTGRKRRVQVGHAHPCEIRQFTPGLLL